MTAPLITLAKSEQIHLKDHPQFTEAWLEDLIVEDPSLLGLGDLAVVARQRTQPKAGRLDLLLEDAGGDRRYEVELMLGKTDESHVVRVIEYWDAERRRYPGYDHVAVLVAEDITSRFLNVLTLFAGSIPLVGLQLTALKVEDKLALHFVRVIDQTQLRQDDTSDAKLSGADRSYWEGKGAKATLPMVDKLLDWINEIASTDYKLNFNKGYIGLSDGFRSTNFIVFHPRKNYLGFGIALDDIDSWASRSDEVGILATPKKRKLRLDLQPKEIDKQEIFLKELIFAAVNRVEGA